MRRIFTFSFIAALLVVSFSSLGQNATCDQTQTGTYRTTGASATLATSGATSTYTYFFPIADYAITTPPTSIPFYLTFNGSNGQPKFTASITIKWGAGGVNSYTCPTTGNISVSSTTANYYFRIDPTNASLPQGTNFQIVVVLTNTGNQPLTLSNAAIDANAETRSGAALPVKFQSLDARTSSNAVSLSWNVATEENLAGYDVERSLDGRTFSKIGFVAASGKGNYSFVDSKSSSVTYYRIKSVDVNGRYAFSTVALVKAGKSMIILKAFPSPFIGSLSVQHGTANAGSLITITSEDGRTIKSVVPAAGTQETKVDLSSAKAGLYLVRYNNGNGEVETLKILKQQ